MILTPGIFSFDTCNAWGFTYHSWPPPPLLLHQPSPCPLRCIHTSFLVSSLSSFLTTLSNISTASPQHMSQPSYPHPWFPSDIFISNLVLMQRNKINLLNKIKHYIYSDHPCPFSLSCKVHSDASVLPQQEQHSDGAVPSQPRGEEQLPVWKLLQSFVAKRSRVHGPARLPEQTEVSDILCREISQPGLDTWRCKTCEFLWKDKLFDLMI